LIPDRLLAGRRERFGCPLYPRLLVLGFPRLLFQAPASRLWGDLLLSGGGWNWAVIHLVGPLQNILDPFEALIQHVPMVLGLAARPASAVGELGLPCLVICRLSSGGRQALGLWHGVVLVLEEASVPLWRLGSVMRAGWLVSESWCCNRPACWRIWPRADRSGLICWTRAALPALWHGIVLQWQIVLLALSWKVTILSLRPLIGLLLIHDLFQSPSIFQLSDLLSRELCWRSVTIYRRLNQPFTNSGAVSLHFLHILSLMLLGWICCR